MRRLLLLLLGGTTLILLGCSGGTEVITADGDQPAAESGFTDAETASAAPSAVDDHSASTDAAPADSLAELFGLPLDAVSDKDVDQFYVEMELETERRTALCMIANGFEYQPVDYSSIAGLSSELDRDSLGYIEQFGFGIATGALDDAIDAYQAFENPNDGYVATLSGAEADAYYIALAGKTAEEMEVATGYVTEGCRGEADADVYRVFGVVRQFLDDIQDLDEQLANRSEVIAARSEWSTCMAEHGIVAETPLSLRIEFRERLAEIKTQDGSYADGSAPPPNHNADPVLSAAVDDPLTPAAIAEIDELGAEEIRAAVHDFHCGVDLRQVEAEARLELEQGFVSSSGQDVLEALNS